MASFLDKNELLRTEGAEITVFRSPVPTRIVSNGEFTPILQTEQQKQVEARIGELADAYGARHRLDRRRFLETSCGIAAAFLAMNQACKAEAAECFIESGANTVVVASMAALANAVNTASPGRNILIAPGVYNGLTQTFNRNGTQANPIVIRPRDGLGTVTINTPRWTLANSSSWLVFEKLYFTAARNIIMGSHNRISRCRFRNINVDASLVINSDSSGGARDCRIDHCDFGDFTAAVPAIHVRPRPFRNGTAARVLIDYCYFHDHLQNNNVIHSFADPTWIDLPRGQTIILDHCLFHNINESGEYVDVKIGGWVTRFCTFTNMNGYLQSRTASNCELRSCWFEGSSHEASKWWGPGHLLIGNRFAGNINLWVPCGNSSFADIKAGTVPISRYAPSTSCRIIGNRMGSGNIIVGEFWSNNPAPGASVRANNNSLQANTRDGGGNAHLLLSTKHGLTPPHTNTTVSGSTSQSFVPAVKLTATNVGLNAPDPLCAQVSGLQPPAQAAAVGYTRLVFQEEFDDTSGIDLADTRQPGFNFYTEPPFGFPQLTEISISNSILRFTGPGGTANGSLYSTVGTTFPNWIGFGAVGGAYFEASIAIPNPNFPIPSPGWPSFWSMANEHLWGPLTGTFDGFLEIDFLEYIWGQNSQLYQSPLNWWGNPKHDYNPNIDPPGTVNYTQFHRYGCLRVPGSRIDAYFGDVLVQSATYAALPWLAGGDSQSMPVILGCDLMEMQVDWVRVWQAP